MEIMGRKGLSFISCPRRAGKIQAVLFCSGLCFSSQKSDPTTLHPKLSSVKAEVNTDPRCGTVWAPPLTSLLLRYPVFPLRQSHWPPAGLLPLLFPLLECSSPGTHVACSFTSSWVLMKCPLLSETFPDLPQQPPACVSFIFLHSFDDCHRAESILFNASLSCPSPQKAELHVIRGLGRFVHAVSPESEACLARSRRYSVFVERILSAGS